MPIIDILSLAGLIAFACSGVLAGYAKNVDLFGAVVLGVVTAIGGGTLRDLLIGADPVFWVDEPWSLIAAISASIIAFFLVNWRHQTGNALAYLDGAGLALFSILGTRIAVEDGLPTVIAVTVGVITGCSGGVMRDVLTNRVPFVFTKELYATAALAGSAVFWFLKDHPPWASVCGAAVVMVLRFGSIHYGWSLPRIRETEEAVKKATEGKKEDPE